VTYPEQDEPFEDRLATKLALSIGESYFEYTAGSIDWFRVALRAWGFDATVVFHVSAEQADDPLLTPLTGTAPISVSFTFARDIEGEDELTRPTLRGLVVARAITEVMGSGILGAPPVQRRYELRFCDPAAALWTSHWPVALYTSSTMAKVIEANKVAGISLDFDWSELDAQRPLLCLPLDRSQGVSFYEFIVGWIADHGGVLEYDLTRGSYRIAGKKRAEKQAAAAEQEIVRKLELRYPAPPRFTTRIRNARAVDAQTVELAQSLSTAGVYRDVLIREPVLSIANARGDLEALQHRSCELELVLRFARCPETLSPPGTLIKFGDDFSTKAIPYGKTFRVLTLDIDARQSKPDNNEPEDAAVVYQTTLRYEAELAAAGVPRLPPHASREVAVEVEGTIVSVGGADSDRTWFATENEDNALWAYKVYISLFNGEVACPFSPLFGSGHFFFPAYKHQRVRVALHWDRAEIIGFLDWSEEGRLPLDSQGNQIVMGPKLGNGTVIRHSYVDQKPVLRVERKTPEETQVISVADGLIRISLEPELVPPTELPTFDVTPQVAAAQDQVVGKVQAGVSTVSAQYQDSAGSLSGAIDGASAEVDANLTTMKAGVLAKVDASEARLQTAADELTGLVADMSAQSASARDTIQAAMPDASAARARIQAAREAQRAKLTAAEQASALAPYDAALTTVSTAEQAAAKLRDTALGTIRGAEQALTTTARGAEEQARKIVEGASDALAALRRGVDAVEAVVQAPMRVLDELIPKIQAPFQLATSALTEVTTRAESVLGAIKATGLPQALVQPAITAITSATQTLLPPLDAMISQAATQLATLGRTLEGQVATAQSAAQQALQQQQTQLENAIDQIVKPLETQLAALRTGVTQATQAFSSSVRATTDATVTALNGTASELAAMASRD
jgi:predicted  nucleic acid-binding Zn-ribbon protein